MPTVVVDPPHDSPMATEEVFGPALPIWRVSGPRRGDRARQRLAVRARLVGLDARSASGPAGGGADRGRLHVDQLAHQGLRRAAVRRLEVERLRQGARRGGVRLLHRDEVGRDPQRPVAPPRPASPRPRRRSARTRELRRIGAGPAAAFDVLPISGSKVERAPVRAAHATLFPAPAGTPAVLVFFLASQRFLTVWTQRRDPHVKPRLASSGTHVNGSRNLKKSHLISSLAVVGSIVCRGAVGFGRNDQRLDRKQCQLVGIRCRRHPVLEHFGKLGRAFGELQLRPGRLVLRGGPRRRRRGSRRRWSRPARRSTAMPAARAATTRGTARAGGAGRP